MAQRKRLTFGERKFNLENKVLTELIKFEQDNQVHIKSVKLDTFIYPEKKTLFKTSQKYRTIKIEIE